MLRRTLAVLAGALVAASLAAPVRAAEPGPPVPPGFVPRTDPLPDGQRHLLAKPVSKPGGTAVGNGPATKQVLLTRPKAGCATTWCTDTVEFFGNGSMNATRTFPGAQFYKVRWFVPAYQ